MFNTVIKLLTNATFYKILKLLLFFIPLFFFIFFLIYRDLATKGVTNELLILKFKKYVDSVLIYEEQSLFKGSVVDYYNTIDEESIKSYLTKYQLIMGLKNKGYKEYVEIKVPFTKLYIILFWYEKPSKKIIKEVELEIKKINNLYSFKNILRRVYFGSN